MTLRKAFTLVELLVVIGIIGLLVSILLPSLNRARQQAYLVACSSNLHNIGLGMAQYLDDYHGFFPTSNYYKGLGFDPVTGQVPTTPVNGYVHWSSFLYGRRDLLNTDAPYLTTKGWEMFQCPALLNGGLAPANTYSGNWDFGLQNEDGLTDANFLQQPSQVDYQAPRLSYTVNEALCPRGIFQPYFSNRNNPRIYKFVPASRVRYPSNVILASELWGTQAVETSDSLISPGIPVSGSRHPVNGISALLTGGPVTGNPDKPYLLLYSKNFVFANLNDLLPDPEVQLVNATPKRSTLDWVGRNHMTKKYGTINGLANWDLRLTNFLYVDGHVESKNVADTVYPVNQWGTDFYTLDK